MADRDTTAGVLPRLDRVIPAGTDIVVLNIGEPIASGDRAGDGVVPKVATLPTSRQRIDFRERKLAKTDDL